jgi:hypothetical protein
MIPKKELHFEQRGNRIAFVMTTEQEDMTFAYLLQPPVEVKAFEPIPLIDLLTIDEVIEIRDNLNKVIQDFYKPRTENFRRKITVANNR